jgi:hypothetical protein
VLAWGRGEGGVKNIKKNADVLYGRPSANPTSQPPFHPQFGINHNEKMPLDATSDENCLAWNLTAASL